MYCTCPEEEIDSDGHPYKPVCLACGKFIKGRTIEVSAEELKEAGLKIVDDGPMNAAAEEETYKAGYEQCKKDILDLKEKENHANMKNGYCTCPDNEKQHNVYPYSNVCVACGKPIPEHEDLHLYIDSAKIGNGNINFPKIRMRVIQATDVDNFEMRVNSFLEREEEHIMHDKTIIHIGMDKYKIYLTAVFFGTFEIKDKE